MLGGTFGVICPKNFGTPALESPEEADEVEQRLLSSDWMDTKLNHE